MTTSFDTSVMEQLNPHGDLNPTKKLMYSLAWQAVNAIELTNEATQILDIGFHDDRTDITALPYQDNAFDVVLLVDTPQFVLAPQDSLHELHRVARNNATICAVMWGTSDICTVHDEIRTAAHPKTHETGHDITREDVLTQLFRNTSIDVLYSDSLQCNVKHKNMREAIRTHASSGIVKAARMAAGEGRIQSMLVRALDAKLEHNTGRVPVENTFTYAAGRTF